MRIRREKSKNLSLQQFWTPKTPKSYKTNQKRYFRTDFIKVKKKNYFAKKRGNCCKFRKLAKWPQTSLNVPIR